MSALTPMNGTPTTLSNNESSNAASLGADSRLSRRFAALKATNRAALVTYLMAGDPDLERSAQLLKRLPAAGADIIELGIPFSDPMADGVAIQRAGQRALTHGQTLARTLEMVREFRERDDDTPIVLMGYLNPIQRFGETRFLEAAAAAGVDGLIVVDLPPEHGAAFTARARDLGLSRIPLVAPTTPPTRLPALLAQGDGFIYRIAYNGITGSQRLDLEAFIQGPLGSALIQLKQQTTLPIAVGFGVRDGETAAAIAKVADAVVVGSALVERLEQGGVEAALTLTRDLADAIGHARQQG